MRKQSNIVDQLRPSLIALLIVATQLIVPFAHGEESNKLGSQSLPPNAPATVLLITSDQLAKAWQPFAEWKTRLGKPTKIVTTQQIEKQYEGKDIQQKIKAAVLAHIDKHKTRFVVLGGDAEPGGGGHVPDRDTKHPMFGYDDIPTDVYYISTKSWDANGDGVYGEWEVDREAIGYNHPLNVAIGRIPVRTVADVKAYTDKVIAYESRYPQKSFADQFIYTCPERVAYPKLNTSRQLVSKAWPTGNVDRFFANGTPWDKDAPGDHDLTPENWKNMINGQRASKIHMHGHGLLPLWVLEKGSKVRLATIASLTNDAAYPVITTVSCFTGHYEAKKDPSITESILRKPNGGAIAVIAPSREGVPVFKKREDFRLMITQGKMDGTTSILTKFWTHGLNKQSTLGEAFAAAKSSMAKDANEHAGYHWVLCELNLLGDPTLDIRAKAPQQCKVKHELVRTADKMTLNITTNAPGAIVCLWSGDALYVSAPADDKGHATFNLDKSIKGNALLAVSGRNLNAYTAVIQLED